MCKLVGNYVYLILSRMYLSGMSPSLPPTLPRHQSPLTCAHPPPSVTLLMVKVLVTNPPFILIHKLLLSFICNNAHGWDLAEWWMSSSHVWVRSSRLGKSVWLPIQTLSSIPASFDTVESEGRQKTQCWIEYLKNQKVTPLQQNSIHIASLKTTPKVKLVFNVLFFSIDNFHPVIW